MNEQAKGASKTRTRPAVDNLFTGGGAIGKLMSSHDWSTSPLGRPASWSPTLRATVAMMLPADVQIVVFWGEHYCALYNDAYAPTIGDKHPQALGRPAEENWAELWDDLRPMLDKVRTKGKTVSAYKRPFYIERKGYPETAYFDISYSPVRNEAGAIEGVLCIVKDVTDIVKTEKQRDAAERELLAERERLRSLFAQAPALIAVLRGPKHIFEMANAKYIETITPGRDIVGLPLTKAIPELKGQGVLTVLDRVLKTGVPYVGEMHVELDPTGNGELRDAHFNLVYQPLSDRKDGKPDGIFVHAVEITEQVRSRREAEELSAQLQAVFDSFPDGLYIASPERITHINQRGAEALGYEKPEDVPRTLDKLYDEIRVQHMHSHRTSSLKDSTLGNALRGKSVEHTGVRITNPITGKVQIVRTAGAPIRDKEGKIIGAVAINNDLTEMYRLQERVQKEKLERQLLKEQNEQLTQLSATKDEFIALTSHQLRTPATGVKQYIGMLMQGYAGPVTPDQEQFLERAFESNERQLHIIEDILRVAKLDMGKTQIQRQLYDIRSLMSNILDEQAERFDARSMQLNTDFPAEPVLAPIDPAQLHMAIGNIVDNAIKYSPDNHSVHVLLRSLPNGSVRLEVSDEGVGIAKADREKLFQKFSRIHNPRSIEVGGTGLGLYWTKQIIELHGGRIEVRSRLGHGTRFIITLPQE